MASSRRRPPVEGPSGALYGAPVTALRDALARIDTDDRILVAFSGGLDSTVLLHAAVESLASAGAGSSDASRERLLAVHVDHRLQAPSADWTRHCVEAGAALGVDCRVVRLAGAPRPGESVEAWAREHRYAAFVAVAEEVGAAALLTGHHADDQLETFLLRLARGAGLDGLVSIEPDTMRGRLRVLRPFLGLPRSVLESWARSRGLAWIEDPSNRDETLLRNAVRRQLVPAIDGVLPALRQRLPQTLAALREERDRLREIDRRSLSGVMEPPCIGIESSRLAAGASALSLSAWRGLPDHSRAGVFRQWLALHGVRMPSRARLAEMLRQLDAPAVDGIEIRHDGFVLRRYRGQAMLLPEAKSSRPAPVSPAIPSPNSREPRAESAQAAPAEAAAGAASAAPAVRLLWRGERRIEIPERAAVLSIEPVEQSGSPGLAEHWLRAPDLELCERRGGERLRMHAGDPHRSLKNLYQERGVPAWLRPALPLLWARGRPIWAAGIGCDADCLVTEGLRYAIDWQPLQPCPSTSASSGSQD